MTLKYGFDAISIVTRIKREGFEMSVLGICDMENLFVLNGFAVIKAHESETKQERQNI